MSEPSPTLVLLVEDEFLIQDLIESHLVDAGYEVIVAMSGPDAVGRLRQGDTQFSGLVTDINLGGPPNGWVVAATARELNPSLPVVYISGDSAHEWEAHGVPHSAMITKPFTGIEVVTALATLRHKQSR